MPPEERPHAAHQPHRRWRAARSRAGRTGSPSRPGAASKACARRWTSAGRLALGLAASPRARPGTGSRPGPRAASCRSRNMRAEARRAPRSRDDELDRVHGRVASQPVLEARAHPVLDAVLEVDDHLDLLRPARHDVAEAARHREERAEHEQAHRDRADRDGVDQTAAPEAREGLAQEVARRRAATPSGRGIIIRGHDRAGRHRRRHRLGQDVLRAARSASAWARTAACSSPRTPTTRTAARSSPAAQAAINYDHPDAFDTSLLVAGPARPQGRPAGPVPHLRPRDLLAARAARPPHAAAGGAPRGDPDPRRGAAAPADGHQALHRHRRRRAHPAAAAARHHGARAARSSRWSGSTSSRCGRCTSSSSSPRSATPT